MQNPSTWMDIYHYIKQLEEANNDLKEQLNLANCKIRILNSQVDYFCSRNELLKKKVDSIKR